MGFLSYLLSLYMVHCTLMNITVLHCFCRGGEFKALWEGVGTQKFFPLWCYVNNKASK